MDELPSSGPEPVTIGERRVSTGTRIRMPGTANGYSVAVPTSGVSQVLDCGREVDADGGHAVVTRSDGDVDMRCSDAFSYYSVRIEDGVLEDALAHRLGHEVSVPALDASVNLRTPAGRAWRRTVRVLALSPRAGRPLLAVPTQETVVALLLLAVDHRYRDELDAPVHSWGPGPVRRMVDAVEATPRHPFTLAELSDVAGPDNNAVVSQQAHLISIERPTGRSIANVTNAVRHEDVEHFGRPDPIENIDAEPTRPTPPDICRQRFARRAFGLREDSVHVGERRAGLRGGC